MVIDDWVWVDALRKKKIYIYIYTYNLHIQLRVCVYNIVYIYILYIYIVYIYYIYICGYARNYMRKDNTQLSCFVFAAYLSGRSGPPLQVTLSQLQSASLGVRPPRC